MHPVNCRHGVLRQREMASVCRHIEQNHSCIHYKEQELTHAQHNEIMLLIYKLTAYFQGRETFFYFVYITYLQTRPSQAISPFSYTY